MTKTSDLRSTLEAILPALKVLRTMMLAHRFNAGADKAHEMIGWVEKALGIKHPPLRPEDVFKATARDQMTVGGVTLGEFADATAVYRRRHGKR